MQPKIAPEDEPANQPEDFETLKPIEQRALLDWISESLKPGKVRSVSSYALKHYFQHVGFYVTNGQFKGAMQRAGYRPLDRDWLNWHYMLDKREPEGQRTP